MSYEDDGMRLVHKDEIESLRKQLAECQETLEYLRNAHEKRLTELLQYQKDVDRYRRLLHDGQRLSNGERT